MMVLLAAAVMASNCLSVGGDSIRASDLARFDRLFASLPPETVLAHSPLPGLTRDFSAAELTRLAWRFGASGRIEAGVCVERAGTRVETNDALAAMREAMAGRSAAIEILELSEAPLPTGALEFPLSGLLQPGPDGVSSWRGWRKTAEGRRYPVPARVRISFETMRAVAVEPLAAGQPLRAEQIRQVRVVAAGLDRRDFASISEVEGSILRRSVSAGSVLTADMLETPMIIRTGQKIEVEVRSGGVVLKLSGTAAGSARRGEVVRVKNPLNGEMLRTRAEGPGRVVAESLR